MALTKRDVPLTDTAVMESEEMMVPAARADWLTQEKYRALQGEAAALRTASTTLEMLCVGATVAAYIWLARDADIYVGSGNFAWFAPPVVALYGMLKSQALALRLRAVRDDTERIEYRQAAQSHGAAAPVPSRRRGERRRWLAGRLAWSALFALTVAASISGFEGLADAEVDDGSEQTSAHIETTAWR